MEAAETIYTNETLTNAIYTGTVGKITDVPVFAGVSNVQTFSTAGTFPAGPTGWQKPPTGSWIQVECIGGGGGGGSQNGGGGGGGAFVYAVFPFASVTNPQVQVIVGAGGATGNPGGSPGLLGGNSQFGPYGPPVSVIAYSGRGGITIQNFGGGGGGMGTPSPSSPLGGDQGGGPGGYGNNSPGATVATIGPGTKGTIFGGGGGGGGSNNTTNPKQGGPSVYGGGGGAGGGTGPGGGAPGCVGGTSVFAGPGGSGYFGPATAATPGTFPGGGGGGGGPTGPLVLGGVGARGQVRVYVF